MCHCFLLKVIYTVASIADCKQVSELVCLFSEFSYSEV